ncbi:MULTISPECIES: carbonic anhydrase [unclassified Microbacterium]|uniref:carbonic anhydrase n=1 Tax=unclassified Microbacterium TaxID=2609290 RepID=UPI0012FBDCDB|nr:carbonic anhydrase [Microbacterium sp. MAH-37]MVQ41981.1 carbonic anhydrase [Microbacterium sp. MAH-37]
MLDGNRRFVNGVPEHPHQDVGKRHELAEGQAPMATLFGCSDSRLAAEIIFDKGLGDLFVVRNAGQVIGESIVASLEYAVEILGVPLIIVLAHDSCGAVRAAIDGTAIDAAPLPPAIWKLISPIVPAARKVLAETGGSTPADIDAELVGREHLRNTVANLLQSSELISAAVAEGRLGIVGANYRLAEGTTVPVISVGIDDGMNPATKEGSE